MEGPGPLCLSCADLDHLVFLPSGDAALTRRAKKASGLSAVVVRFSRARGRYERQGLLVEEPALGQAEEECRGDEEARHRRRAREEERRADVDVEFQSRLAARIMELYPGCPEHRAHAIATHAAARGSGRVGRSAAGRALDSQAVTLGVAASVRHEDTKYDDLLMAGMARADARDSTRSSVEEILERWQRPRPPDPSEGAAQSRSFKDVRPEDRSPVGSDSSMNERGGRTGRRTQQETAVARVLRRRSDLPRSAASVVSTTSPS